MASHKTHILNLTLVYMTTETPTDEKFWTQREGCSLQADKWTKPQKGIYDYRRETVPFALWWGAVLSRMAYHPPLEFITLYARLTQDATVEQMAAITKLSDVKYDHPYDIRAWMSKVRGAVPNQLYLARDLYLESTTDYSPAGGTEGNKYPMKKKQEKGEMSILQCFSRYFNNVADDVRKQYQNQGKKGKASDFGERYSDFNAMSAENRAVLEGDVKGQVRAFYIHTNNDLSCYLVADKRMNSISVVFRGSTSVANWKTNVQMFGKSLCHFLRSTGYAAKFKGAKGPSIYTGFLNLENECIHTIFYTMIYLAKEFLLDKDKLNKDDNLKNPRDAPKVFVFGHSLGGALASIFSLYYAGLKSTDANEQRRKVMSVLNLQLVSASYGSPRVFGKQTTGIFDSLIDMGFLYFKRYVTRGDPVTEMPLEKVTGMQHAGKNCDPWVVVACDGGQSHARLVGSAVGGERGAAVYNVPLNCSNYREGAALPFALAHANQLDIDFVPVLGQGAKMKAEGLEHKDLHIKIVEINLEHKDPVRSYVFPMKILESEAAKKAQSSEDDLIKSYEMYKQLIIANLEEDKTHTAGEHPKLKEPDSTQSDGEKDHKTAEATVEKKTAELGEISAEDVGISQVICEDVPGTESGSAGWLQKGTPVKRQGRTKKSGGQKNTKKGGRKTRKRRR